jgi:hypothetical protein
LTRDFRETVRTRLRADPAFRRAVMTEVAKLLQAGEESTANAMLRDVEAVEGETGFTSR